MAQLTWILTSSMPSDLSRLLFVKIVKKFPHHLLVPGNSNLDILQVACLSYAVQIRRRLQYEQECNNEDKDDKIIIGRSLLQHELVDFELNACMDNMNDFISVFEFYLSACKFECLIATVNWVNKNWTTLTR